MREGGSVTGNAEAILSNLVRVGTVSSIDSSKYRVRVYYQDKGIVSGWLGVVQTSDTKWMPNVNDTVLCLYQPLFNGDGFVLGEIK